MTKRLKRPQRLPDADAVLSGRVTIDAPTLVALIHAVNPTGREISPKERARRYELKSRLQSLLVLRHRNEIAVRPDPDHPELALLELTRLGGDACHAVISELEPDARSWVQLRADIERSPEVQSPEPPRSKSPLHARHVPARSEPAEPSLHEIGLAALSDYDYETAKDALLRACRDAPGDPRVAADALGLLVDQLAADDESRKLWSDLAEPARQTPGVRVLAAIAFARSGARGELPKLLDGLEDARVADVLWAAAESALADGGPGEAEQWRAQLYELDPAHEKLGALDDAIRASRARAAKDDELALEERARAGASREELERLARAVLESFPESRVARATLRTIRESERKARSDALVSRMQEALDAADLRAAGEVLSDAQWPGVPRAERESLEQRLRELGQRRAEELRQAAVARVDALLATDFERGLAAYLELEPQARARVRQVAERHAGVFATLDAIADRAASRDSAAAAASALEQALAMRSDAPEEAFALVERHERVLLSLPAYRNLRKAAREHARRKRHEAAADALRRGLELEQSTDLESAIAVLGSIEPGALDPHERAELASARARVEQADRLSRVRQQVERLLGEGRLIDARRALEAVLEHVADGARDELGAAVERVQRAIQEEFRVTRYDGDFPPAVARDFSWPGGRDRAPSWVRGQELVLLDSVDRWVFVFFFDIAERTIRRTLRLRTPEPMQVMNVRLDGDRIWATGSRGQVLAFSSDEGRIEEWFSPVDSIVAPDDIVEDAEVAACRWLWIAIRREQRSSGIVYDLHKRRKRRELPGIEQIELSPIDEPGIVALRDRGGTELFRSNGASARTLHPGWVDAVLPHPDPSRRSLLGTAKQVRAGEYEELCLVELDSGRELVFANVDALSAHTIAVSRDEQLVFAHLRDDEGNWQLVTIGLASGLLVEIDRRPASLECYLVTDRNHTRAWAVTRSADGPIVTPLTRASVDLPRAPKSVRWLDVPHARSSWYCMEGAGTKSEHRAALDALSSSDAQRARAEQLWSDHEGDPNALWRIARAVRHALRDSREWANELEQRLRTQHAESAVVRLAGAGEAARDGNWELVLELLRGIDPGELAPEHRRHFHHALASAKLRFGELEAARRSLHEAEGIEGECDLADISAVLDALEAQTDHERSSALHPAHRLVRAIVTADRELASSNPGGALAAIRAAECGNVTEIQFLARAASAWLAVEARSAAEGIEKLRTVARFLDQLGERPRLEVLLPSLWNEDELQSLAERARAWLETQ